MPVWLELNGWWKLYMMPPRVFTRGWMEMLWHPPISFVNPTDTIHDAVVTVQFRRDVTESNAAEPPCHPEYPVFRGTAIG